MEETKKSIAILKARYPELCLIIGLNVFSFLFNKFISAGENSSLQASMFNLLCFLSLLILMQILTIGFQRSIYLHGQHQQPPMVLLKTGLRFFWRMVKLSLLWFPAFCILAYSIYLITKNFTSTQTGFFEIVKESPLLFQFYLTMPALILIKFYIFIPVLIIVLDCQIAESFACLKNCRLSEAKELVILSIIYISSGFVWALMPEPEEIGTITYHSLLAAFVVVSTFIYLIVVVTAIRFVASLKLAYNNQNEQSEPQA